MVQKRRIIRILLEIGSARKPFGGAPERGKGPSLHSTNTIDSGDSIAILLAKLELNLRSAGLQSRTGLAAFRIIRIKI